MDISNLELRRSYNTLQSNQVLPDAMTLSNIRRWEYALTVDTIKKKLPWQNQVSLALDR